jgi:O-antigen/teichoic acid export membrane protein
MSLKRNLVASWGEQAINLLIGLCLMPFVLHTIGDGPYGTWVFINSIAGYSGLLYLGFGQTISRFVADLHARNERDRMNGVVNVVLAVYSSMAVLALVLAILLAWLSPRWHDGRYASANELSLVIMILGAHVATGLVGSVFGGVLMGVQRFDLCALVAAVCGFARVGLTVAVLQSDHGLLRLALIFLAITVLENAGCAWLAFRQIPWLSIGRRHLKASALRECFSFSIYAFINAISSQLIDATDTILIGLVCGAEAIVPYNIAQRLCLLLCRPIQQIASISMPRAGALSAAAHGGRLRELTTGASGLSLLLVGGFLVGASFFGGNVIRNWVGPGYEQSLLLLLVLLAAKTISIPLGVLRSVLLGMGLPRLPAFLLLAQALANLALSLVLVRYWGLLGVALGTLIPVLIVELLLFLPLAAGRLELSPNDLWRRVVGPQAPALAGLAVYCTIAVSAWQGPLGWASLVVVCAGGGAVLIAGRLAWWYVDDRQRQPGKSPLSAIC